MSILIKNARLLNPFSGFDGITDVLIKSGVVARIGENIEAEADTVINAEGMWAAPGLIDVHCHLREPGYEYKETIETGAKSAAIGGFTTICAMPNTNPPVDSAEVVEYVLEKAKNAVIRVLPVGAITVGMEGTELTNFAELKKAGVCAVSEDGKTVGNGWLMLKAMLEAAKNGLPVFCHCEDVDVSPGGVMNDGEISDGLGLTGIKDEAEEVIIEREIEFQKQSNAQVHICHVSTKGGVELIRKAKLEGLNVTAEVCPHHFSLTDIEVARHGTNAKMSPPLRDSDDVAALIDGLCDGAIDIIATDHAPHSREEKSAGITRAPFGIIGFETALSLAITNLVDTGRLTPLQLIEKMSANPAKLLGIEGGHVGVGMTADIVIIDPNCTYVVDTDKFESKSSNCPCGGMTLTGKVFANIAGGKIVVDNYKGVWNVN